MTGVPTPTLVVVTGPTGSGKSALAVELAKTLGCDIISADSRQIYKHISIGTAAPTYKQMQAVRHHFVGVLELDAYYSASMFEADVLALLPSLWQKSPFVVMCGGSMMYIDAVCNGIDDLPTVSPEIRAKVYAVYEKEGIDALRKMLSAIDPVHFNKVDKDNPKRMLHAIEVSMQAGAPYSSLCTGVKRVRPWRTVKLAIGMPREQLFDRINRRVCEMIDAGWEKEAAAVYHLQHLNSLNTVGFKELFAMMDGDMDRDTALARIAKNTRVYAKKQITWLKRDPDVVWLSADNAYRQALDIITNYSLYL